MRLWLFIQKVIKIYKHVKIIIAWEKQLLIFLSFFAAALKKRTFLCIETWTYFLLGGQKKFVFSVHMPQCSLKKLFANTQKNCIMLLYIFLRLKESFCASKKKLCLKEFFYVLDMWVKFFHPLFGTINFYDSHFSLLFMSWLFSTSKNFVLYFIYGDYTNLIHFQLSALLSCLFMKL